MRATIRLTLVALVAAAIAPVLAQDQLPKGDALLDKYIEVTGGKAAYQKLNSAIATGSVTLSAAGIKGTLTIYQSRPALMLSEANIAGIGKLQDGFDGTVAWSLSAVQGPHVKDGEEKALAVQQATIDADVKWRDFYTKAETVGVEDVNGKPCYKVVLTPKVGSAETRFYDKESNLLVKTARKVTTAMGEVDAEMAQSDYRKDGDILSPHTTIQRAGGMEVVMTIDSIQYNVEIPKEKFAIPDEIKALTVKK